MSTNPRDHKIGTRKEWLVARRELLKKEKELTHANDALTRERLALPWVKVEESYVFDAPDGRKSLADLFGKNSQLIVVHFMFGPGWKEGCVGCSFGADHMSGPLMHLPHHDVSMAVVSRAPIADIEEYKKRMGWNFQWVSSNTNKFNFDYHVSFTQEEVKAGRATYNFEELPISTDELPGYSSFYKNPAGEIFHTYSVFARGTEKMNTTYQYLDMAPLGRNEGEHGNLTQWVKRHDSYNPAALIDANSLAAKPR